MTNLDEIGKMAEDLTKKVNGAFANMLTPQVLGQLSDEQKKLINETKKACSLSGVDLSDSKTDLDSKMESLQKLSKKLQHAATNNR